MSALADDEAPGPGDEPDRHTNRLETPGGVGEVVQARDVLGGVHFHPARPESFEVTPRQLPGPAQGFVNRDSELASLAEIMTGGQHGPLVIVITGTAGVGKTSLALRWAHRIRDQFPDGQLYANLRGYDPGPPAAAAQVLGRFLRDLGVPGSAIPTAEEDRATLYRSILAGKRMLLVLDNAATVPQVRPLLPGAAECLVVVTSRSRLSGLVSREGARRVPLNLLTEDDAVALLRAAAERYRPDDPHSDLVELARLCARLPLALRIAAERAASRPLMQLTELITDLRDESGLWDALSGNGDSDADAVRTVFAWSYRALPEPAAAMFRLLGLHPGNEFSPPAAAALAGVAASQARHDLDALVGAHLIEHRGPDRYQFHDLLRAYAVDQVRQLESAPARATALRRVLRWYLNTANAVQQLLSPFDRYRLPEPNSTDLPPLAFGDWSQAYRWYDTEANNLAAAVDSAARAREHAIAWQLAAVLGGIYMHQNALDDWIATGRIGVASAAQLDDRAGQAITLDSLGKAYFQSRRLADAEQCHRQALHIRRELGDQLGVAASVNALGLLALRRRRLAEAAAHFRDGAGIAAKLGELRWEALLRSNLAEVWYERGEFRAAVDQVTNVLPRLRELGDRAGEGNALFLLACAHRGDGRFAAAQTSIADALAIADQDDNDTWRGYWLAELARLQLAQGEPGEALVSSQRAAVIQRRLGDRSREATALDLTGLAYQQLDRPDEAADFHRQAAAVHRELGDTWQLAGTLAQLATALERAGEPDQAPRHRQEAVALLADFDDPPAASLRQRLTRLQADR